MQCQCRGYRLATPTLLCLSVVPGFGLECSSCLKGFLSPSVVERDSTCPRGCGDKGHIVWVRCVCPAEGQGVRGARACVCQISGDDSDRAMGCPGRVPQGPAPGVGWPEPMATVWHRGCAWGCPVTATSSPRLSLPHNLLCPPAPGSLPPCLLGALLLPQGFFPGMGKQGHIQPCSTPALCARGIQSSCRRW